MRVCLVLILLFFGAVSCGPKTTFHRTGASVSLMQNTLLDCQVAALKDAPVSSQIRQGPPRYIPGSSYCHKDGDCYRRAGYFAPGEVYTVDTNARLRSNLTTRCMAREGFQRVQLPRCPAGTPAPDISNLTDEMPPLSADSCLLKLPGGGSRIVSPTG